MTIRDLFLHLALSMTAALIGCSRQLPPKYFVTSTTIERTSEKPKENLIEKVAPTAGNLLEGGKATIAFLPPNWCEGGETDAKRHSETERNICLSFVSDMEKRAAVHGFTVVDWRLFKQNPHEEAKRQQLDALFIIEDLQVKDASTDITQVREITFSNQVSKSRREPLKPDNEASVRSRCRAALAARERYRRKTDDITNMTVAIKMVSPRDGTAKWFYRHSVDDDNRPTKTTIDDYYLSEGSKKTKVGRLVSGVLFSSIGISGIVAGSQLNKNGDSFARRNIGFGVAWLSTLPLTVGLILTTVGIVAQAKPPVYQPPDTVICAREPLEENPMQGTAPEKAPVDEGPVRQAPLKETTEPETTPQEPETPPQVETLAKHLFGEITALSLDRTFEPVPTPSDALPTDATIDPDATPEAYPAGIPIPEGAQIIITEKPEEGGEETSGRKGGHDE